MSETEVQREILDWLDKTGRLCWRNLNLTRYGKSKYNPKGMPDIFCLIGGMLLGIEVKAQGGRTSKEQLAYGDLLNRHGASFCIAYNVSDVKDHIDTMGGGKFTSERYATGRPKFNDEGYQRRA